MPFWCLAVLSWGSLGFAEPAAVPAAPAPSTPAEAGADAPAADSKAEPADAKAKTKDKAKAAKAHAWCTADGPLSRVTIQPNGWGRTPAEATRDLDRVMSFYEKLPGFRRDRYVAVVHVGRDMYQADGRCSYLVPKKPAAKGPAPQNTNVASGGFARKGGHTGASH